MRLDYYFVQLMVRYFYSDLVYKNEGFYKANKE